MNELDAARSELGALAPDEFPCEPIRLRPRRAHRTASRALARQCARLSGVPAFCAPPVERRPIFWYLVPCIAVAWAWLLSGVEDDHRVRQADDAVVLVAVDVVLVEAPAEGGAPDVGEAPMGAPEPEDAAPPAAAGEPPRPGTASLLAALAHRRSCDGPDLPPATPTRPPPAERTGLIPTSASSAGGGRSSTRRHARDGLDDQALALGAPDGRVDARCRGRRLAARPTPPIERDGLRLCGRGPPSTLRVA